MQLKNVSDLGEQSSCRAARSSTDAVLRSLEMLLGRDVIRPDIAGSWAPTGPPFWRSRKARRSPRFSARTSCSPSPRSRASTAAAMRQQLPHHDAALQRRQPLLFRQPLRERHFPQGRGHRGSPQYLPSEVRAALRALQAARERAARRHRHPAAASTCTRITRCGSRSSPSSATACHLRQVDRLALLQGHRNDFRRIRSATPRSWRTAISKTSPTLGVKKIFYPVIRTT
ncbi:MAG: hypothetical protein ACFWTZ_09725 [Burkholderia sp.]|jgi:hypothetical protein